MSNSNAAREFHTLPQSGLLILPNAWADVEAGYAPDAAAVSAFVAERADCDLAPIDVTDDAPVRHE